MSAAEEIDYDLLAEKIAERIASAPPPESVLWDKVQCAKYMKYSTFHFSERIAAKPSFPKPINFSEKSKGKKLWYAHEVMKWLAEQQR